MIILLTFSNAYAKFSEADLNYAQKKINDNPDNAENYYNLGVVCNDLNRYDEAIEAYKKAIELKNNYIEAQCNLGVTYENLNKNNDAFDAFKNAVFIDSNNFGANFGLANVYRKIGNYDEAIKFYKKAIESKRNSYESYYNLGLAYEKANKLNEAEKSYKQAVEIKPDYDKALDKLVNIQILKADNEKVVNNYKKQTENLNDSPKRPANTPNQNIQIPEPPKNPKYKVENIMFYGTIMLVIFILLAITIFLFIPAFFLMIGSGIADIENSTYKKSLLATISSTFIFYFIVSMEIRNFQGLMLVAFILSIISIQTVYKTTFGKALTAWIFGTVTMMIANYIVIFLLFYFVGGYMLDMIPGNVTKNYYIKKAIELVSKPSRPNTNQTLLKP